MGLQMHTGIPVLASQAEARSASRFLSGRGVPFQEQKGDYLCWAACASMVEAVRGTLRRSQCKLVEDVVGLASCCPQLPKRCDVATTRDRIRGTLRRSCPRVKERTPAGVAWLTGWLDKGLVMALWEWSDTTAEVSQHVVLIVGYRAAGNEHQFILHDPLTSGPDPVSYSAIADANGSGRWKLAWVDL